MTEEGKKKHRAMMAAPLLPAGGAERVRDAAIPLRRPAPYSHARLAGVLRAARRGGLLETEDGTLWRVLTALPLDDFFDRHVVVEGRVGEQDELSLIWIGAGSASSEVA